MVYSQPEIPKRSKTLAQSVRVLGFRDSTPYITLYKPPTLLPIHKLHSFSRQALIQGQGQGQVWSLIFSVSARRTPGFSENLMKKKAPMRVLKCQPLSVAVQPQILTADLCQINCDILQSVCLPGYFVLLEEIKRKEE